MSLSQKHAGLIFVPWFNSDEWRYVYKLAYSGDKGKQATALELLKIWKIRTPILSTGVEGTLILLEVLVLEEGSLPDEQLTNLYAVALMRFLNLSAANSDRQGSFTKTSAKNELPKWLTNLRHDIAHGHQMPSKYNLNMGIEYGFYWLKEKYWEPQSKIITDYYVNIDDSPGDTNIDDTLINSLQIYIEINVNLFEETDLEDEFYEKIRSIIYRKYKRKNVHPYIMLEIFFETISQRLEKDHGIGTVQKCLNILVSTKALLKSNFNVLVEKDDTAKVNKRFVNSWTKLLNLFHHYGMLYHLINKLFDIIGNISYSEQVKKMASSWIYEIYLALQNLKEPNNSEEKGALHLENNSHTYMEESLEFQNKLLYYSTQDMTQYTADFLESMLRYNSKNETFKFDASNLLKADAPENLHNAENKIYTLEDLKVENLTIEDVQASMFNETNKEIAEFPGRNCAQFVGGNKWKKIEDTSIFRNCPLGVLPHQINGQHPFLILE